MSNRVVILVHTNRWDPRLNYPGSMGVVMRLRLYIKDYLSDFHDVCISFSFFFFLYMLPHAFTDILGRLAQHLLVADRKS